MPTGPRSRRRSGPETREASLLRAAYRVTPLGLPVRDTMLSWEPRQASSSTVHCRSLGPNDTGTDFTWEATATHPAVVLPGDLLHAAGRYAWSVDDGAETTFETGLRPADWRASWISGPRAAFPREDDDPAPYLRTEFDLDTSVERGRLYATALGIYRVWLNGTEVTSSELFRPGWTDYRARVHHQTFDCTDLLIPGRNTLAVILAKGWYAGRLGLQWAPGFYGNRPAFRAQLETWDGTDRHLAVATDATWRTATGAVVASDLLRGEIVDERREPLGWRTAGFDDSHWEQVETTEQEVEVVPQPHESIRPFKEHRGTLVHQHARGPAIFDFGQNLVGWTRVTSHLTPGAEVLVRHGEILTPHRLVYRDNLRGAFQEDRYTDDGEGRRSLETRFAMHGFRYAEVWGLANTTGPWHLRIPDDTEVVALSVDAAMEPVGSFTCSDEQLTAFSRAVEWTVRDNFLEVATDCPQRDERLGWLGDAGVISPTASYYFDVAAFLGKFVEDAADAQCDDGSIPSYVPVVPPADLLPGAPGWADGYVRMLSLLVRRYGDLATAERHFDGMMRYLDFVERENPDGIRRNSVGSDYGDWLSLPEREGEEPHPAYAYTEAFSTSPKAVVATAHTYQSLRQAADIAGRLGRTTQARALLRRAAEVRDSYHRAFVGDDGRVPDATQTVYAQGIGYGLVEGAELARAAALLRERVDACGHVTTGIHGVEHILPALARNGHADLASQLLLRREMPSWLHMVASGGTTVWEKWDGIRPDGSLATAEMNSFNHCALGAVGTFLFEDLLGLRIDGAVHGEALEIAPTYLDGLEWVSGSHRGPTGEVGSSWERRGKQIRHLLELPDHGPQRFVAPHGMRVRTIDGQSPSDPHTLPLAGSACEVILEVD